MVKLSERDRQQMEKAKDLIESDGAAEMGFVRSLFFGRLRLDRLMPYPRQDPAEAARTDELIARVEAFLADQVDADRIDAEERIPDEVIRGLGELGVLGMTVPTEYGGGGFSHTAYCRVLERIARHCAGTAVMVGAHQSIGLKALLLNGTEDQKRRWLPELASGRMLAAFCLSEPEVGSDAANVQTRARLSEDGQYWIIDGQKKYATNAAIAGFMTVMARTAVVDDDGRQHDKVSAFIVTPDLEGFHVVRQNRSKCGIRGSWQAELRFDGMKVPADRVLGEMGRGLKVALTVLNYGRCTLSAGCLAGAREALARSVEHARTRRQFSRRIGDFHLIKQKLARMGELTFAMDALTYLSAGLVDGHAGDIMLETAISKLFCSEAGWRVIDDAVQVHGGEGYMRDRGLERMLRDARINRIVEGTTEVMTSFVALMGLKGVGEQFEAVLGAMRRPIANIGRLTAFAGHEFRDVLIGHAADGALDGLRPQLRAEGVRLARLTRRLARTVTRLLATHRERILDLQLIHQRVALSAVEIYAMAAVIAKLDAMLAASDGDGDGHGRGLARDLLIGRAYCRHAADRVRRRLAECTRHRDGDVLAVADALLDGAAGDKPR
ncbi:MAG: putative acyl-CoA dehydrogenase FadE10 [Phycisphaerae bacterium]|nr:putative acyl-CoA dehydrogenase FadE10 [Phycisphaerae bacterium]